MEITKLEDVRPNATVRGILPDTAVSVDTVPWFGCDALELIYKDPAGKVANQLLYRHDEPPLSFAEGRGASSFDPDAVLFRPVSEAHLATRYAQHV